MVMVAFSSVEPPGHGGSGLFAAHRRGLPPSVGGGKMVVVVAELIRHLNMSKSLSLSVSHRQPVVGELCCSGEPARKWGTERCGSAGAAAAAV